MDNFRQVTDKLYRGGRPATENDLAWLRDVKGVRRIVNLQGFVAEFAQVGWERDECIRQDLEFVHVPMNLVSPPAAADIAKAIEATAIPFGAVYLHCHDGVDRTGVVCAAMLMKLGATFGRAVGEMIDGGFHLDWYALWLPFLKRELAGA